MSYGLTANGFIMKRGDQVLQSLKDNLRALFPTLDLSDQTPEGQILGVLSKPIAEEWEVANAVYNSQYPNGAIGQSLDNDCEFNAIVRLGASPDRAVLSLNGTEGTIVNSDLNNPFQAQTIDKSLTFQATETVTITVNSTNMIIVEVSTVLSNTNYLLTINQHSIQITSGNSATAISIAQQLVDEINTLTNLILCNAYVPETPDGTFTVVANDFSTPFTAIPDAHQTIVNFWTPIITLATINGAIPAPSNTITYIVTPVFGLSNVTNLQDATLGREIETDAELRLRRYASIRIVGAGTVDSIYARILQQVFGVTQCKVYENVEDYTDINGLPPHSVEALVVGGSDLDIANKLWQVKSGGIKTYGTTSVTIYDSQNKPHVVSFQRPINDYIWMQITLTIFPDIFPDNGVASMTNAILLQSENFGIGDEIIIQSFYAAIYSIPGVESAIIGIAMTSDLTPPSSYVNTNLIIGENEASIFDSSRIEILIP